MKGSLVAIGPEVEFQGLQFDASLGGRVGNSNRREVRLAGPGAQTGELRTFETDLVISARPGIREDLEGLARLAGQVRLLSQQGTGRDYKTSPLSGHLGEFPSFITPSGSLGWLEPSGKQWMLRSFYWIYDYYRNYFKIIYLYLTTSYSSYYLTMISSCFIFIDDQVEESCSVHTQGG